MDGQGIGGAATPSSGRLCPAMTLRWVEGRSELGFCGLGAMGQLIVPRLMAAGHKVTGWNRSRDKAEPLIDTGMHWADSPKAVAEASEIVFSIVTDSAAVKAVALGPDGIVSGLRRGGIYIDMSTIEPDASRAIAEQIRRGGFDYAGRPAVGQPRHRQGRPCLDDDRRRRRSVRAGQAGAAGDRTEGDPHRRQRPRLPDEDRGESPAHGRGDLLRRGGRTRREGRRVARSRGRCHPQERCCLTRAGLSRAVYSGRQDAAGAARRCHAATKGHAAGAQSRATTRQSCAARCRRQRDDERLPRTWYRRQ